MQGEVRAEATSLRNDRDALERRVTELEENSQRTENKLEKVLCKYSIHSHIHMHISRLLAVLMMRLLWWCCIASTSQLFAPLTLTLHLLLHKNSVY
jgi:hypothetical protein